MTLKQWVDELPEPHRVNREYKELLTQIDELEADIRFYRDGDVDDSNDPVMLRERVKELETVNGALRDAASNNLARVEELEESSKIDFEERDKQLKRVEELGKDNESLLGKIVFLREGAEKREARVGELEKERDRLAGRNVELEAACLGYDGLHITEEQINAAVEVTKRPGRSGAVREGMWMVLNRPNIFRCKAPGCYEGLYIEGNNDGSERCTRPCEVCAKFTGRGWVIKEPK